MTDSTKNNYSGFVEMVGYYGLLSLKNQESIDLSYTRKPLNADSVI